MWEAPCSNETSALADVEMASAVASPLLEVADAPGAGPLWLEGEHRMMSNLSPLRKPS